MTLALPPSLFPPEPDPEPGTGRAWLALAVIVALLTCLLSLPFGCGP